MKLGKLDLAKFKFRGSLQSAFVDSSELDVTFMEGADQIEGASIDEFEDFCMRAFLTPKTSLKANLTLVLYPLSLSQLSQEYGEFYEDTRFPGLQVTKREINCGVPTKALSQPPWGSPILAGLLTGDQAITEDNRPNSLDILRGLFSLMSKASLPELKQSTKAIVERWGVIQEAGVSNLRTSRCDWQWPDPPTLHNDQSG